LDPDHFSIDGPIQIHPVSQTGHLDDPSAVTAKITTRIYDKTDLLRIHIVKPLIFNNSIATVSYVIGGNKFSQASSFKPLLEEISFPRHHHSNQRPLGVH
jgi:hypothetical protein